jgi:phospholipid-binding lipoprotein MlaA
MQTTIRVSALSFVLVTLLGCAAAPAKKDPRDPWERLNRTTYKVNDKLDKAVLRPIVHGYAKVIPSVVRTGISNFFDNLGYPIVVVNDLLQARFTLFAKDTGRLLMNTTLGIGGLLDPASQAGLQKNDNDFGLTFGYWGIAKGPYFVIPFLGPSDVRDGLGRIPNSYLSPQNYVHDDAIEYSVWVVELLDARYRLVSSEQYLDSAYDPYLFMKNAYLQRRDFLLSNAKGGTAPSPSESEADKLLDEATKEEDEQQQSTPPSQQPQPQGQEIVPPKPPAPPPN